MAIIKCPECGKEISDASEVCIHCGYPIKSKEETSNPDNTASTDNEQNSIKEDTTTIEENVKTPNENTSSNKEGNSKQEDEENKKKKMKKLGICAIVIAAIIGIYLMSTVKIPDLYDVSQSNAEMILSSKGLIPTTEYIYDDYIAEGNVVYSYPYDGQRVPKNSLVTIYVSKGPSLIYASDSTIAWWGSAEWHFYTPYIQEGYLYIECDPTFKESFKWKSSNGEEGFGEASITDTFTKKVPLIIQFENQEVRANVPQKITLKVSINDLDVKKPTTLYTELAAQDKHGNYFDINVNFTISW